MDKLTKDFSGLNNNGLDQELISINNIPKFSLTKQNSSASQGTRTYTPKEDNNGKDGRMSAELKQAFREVTNNPFSRGDKKMIVKLVPYKPTAAITAKKENVKPNNDQKS